jgi:hypothetical protein
MDIIARLDKGGRDTDNLTVLNYRQVRVYSGQAQLVTERDVAIQLYGLEPTTNLKLKSVPGLKISQRRGHIVLRTENDCLLFQLGHLPRRRRWLLISPLS